MKKTYKQIVREMADLNEKINKTEDAKEREALVAQYEKLKKDAEVAREEAQAENLELEAKKLKREGGKNVSEEIRTFLREAKPRTSYQFALNREGAAPVVTSTTDTTPYVQGVTLVDLFVNDRADADVLSAAGVSVQTGVQGSKIQWAYADGVEAAFANELDKTTERKPNLGAQSPIQQRLTCRVRISQQALENSNVDLQALFTGMVQKAIANKISWAAASTTKATANLYGGFANAAETGTYGTSGYKSGKQVGTYTALTKQVFVDAIKKVASRNIPLKNHIFVLGSEDFWDAKVTPIDPGSGVMLMGADNRILGVKVVECNAINRATEKGAIAGHNIGFGDFAYLPVMQHGSVRLSIDGGSAYASDTDELIITINTDFSMTVLQDMADAFVVMSKTTE